MTSTGGRSTLEELGGALAAPGRWRILSELLAGPPLPAGALAVRVGLAPSTVSTHLARLERAGFIRVEQVGRARLARIASDEVAEAIEAMLRLTGEPAVTSLRADQRRTAMRDARSCYDHLAGRVAVCLLDAGVQSGWLVTAGGTWGLRDATGEHALRALGLPLRIADTSRPLIRACDDWTERRPHLAGRFGRAMLDGMLDDDWLRRRRDDRALTVTRRGRERFAELGIELG